MSKKSLKSLAGASRISVGLTMYTREYILLWLFWPALQTEAFICYACRLGQIFSSTSINIHIPLMSCIYEGAGHMQAGSSQS